MFWKKLQYRRRKHILVGLVALSVVPVLIVGASGKNKNAGTNQDVARSQRPEPVAQQKSAAGNNARTMTYQYDEAGRLDIMTDGASSLIVDYDFDSAGRMTRKTLGNGVYTIYAYDAAGRLSSLINQQSGADLISRFDYTYDASGRVTSKTSTYAAGDPRQSGTETYGYDDLGQLTRVEYPDGRIVEYVYDAVGNRIEVIEDGISTPYTTNEMNQYTDVDGEFYTYDDDGNLIAKSNVGFSTVYTYDAENRLVKVEQGPVASGWPQDTWEYTYDAFGNRIRTVHNGEETNYIIDPVGYGNVAAEYDGFGSQVARYDHGYGLVSRTDAGADAYYTFDALGSTSDLLDGFGAVLNHYSYDPFGITLNRAEGVANDFEFIGSGSVTHEAQGEIQRTGRERPSAGQGLDDVQ